MDNYWIDRRAVKHKAIDVDKSVAQILIEAQIPEGSFYAASAGTYRMNAERLKRLCAALGAEISDITTSERPIPSWAK
jgi:hypothetical protein